MNERRRDPTTGEWVTLSTARQGRTFLPAFDQCPLCPGRGEVPRPAFEVVVFDNRFPALMADPPPPDTPGRRLEQVAPAAGASEVVLYSDDHSLTLAAMGAAGVRRLVEVWAERYADLAGRDEVAYVLVFENKGEAVGVTLHHPHGQVYGYPEIPPRPLLELTAAAAHLEAEGTCVHCDVVAAEVAGGARLVAANQGFAAFVPFAPRFPYEVHVAARRHVPSLPDLTDPERDDLAEVLARVLTAYDGLFGFSLPYVMAMHQAPTDGGPWEEVSHLHVELYPFHRTATKLKYLAGSELGGGSFLVDVAPEDAAAELRAPGSGG
ncbi:MAG TPA: galactose-1-phosphate uridylyltransferase [Acidimicrobiales bacterium]|nr:galactose-1-phosphate uridylyltransferase [Acidimicrobiales bacterium]